MAAAVVVAVQWQCFSQRLSQSRSGIEAFFLPRNFMLLVGQQHEKYGPLSN